MRESDDISCIRPWRVFPSRGNGTCYGRRAPSSMTGRRDSHRTSCPPVLYACRLFYGRSNSPWECLCSDRSRDSPCTAPLYACFAACSGFCRGRIGSLSNLYPCDSRSMWHRPSLYAYRPSCGRRNNLTGCYGTWSWVCDRPCTRLSWRRHGRP